jgi:hypothetical protein
LLCGQAAGEPAFDWLATAIALSAPFLREKYLLFHRTVCENCCTYLAIGDIDRQFGLDGRVSKLYRCTARPDDFRDRERIVAVQPPASFTADTVQIVDLTSPVRHALRRLEAEVLDWRWQEMTPGVGNPVSAGVFRFSGTASDHGAVLPWTMILKVMQSPGNLGMIDIGEGPDETHWNYWRRERLLFESDLLVYLPHDVRAPECYGTAELPGQIAWLWLEDVSDAHGGVWPPERYELAAYHLGRLNGAYPAGKPLPTHPWLGRNVARQLVNTCRLQLIPAVARYLPDAPQHAVIQFILECDSALDRMDRSPQTVCHFDAGRANLMSRGRNTGEQETVAIDWALAGIGPVGVELSQLVSSIGDLNQVGAGPSEESLIARYLSGLNDVGCAVDRREVLFNYSTFMVIRLGAFFLYFLYVELDSGREVTLETIPISTLLPHVERARDLLSGTR